jgi:hypothetical protein
MKRKLLITTALLCFFGVAFAFVADVSGAWTGKLLAPDGNEYPLNYTLKVDGDKLTGKGASPQGDVDIANGKVKGDSLSFTIDVGGVTVLNSGKYFTAGDSISLNVDYQGYKMHSTLTRAPAGK